MSAFQTAIAAGLASIRTAAGETVTYIRGASRTTLTAVPGQTNTQRVGADDATVEVKVADWLIEVAELELDGHAIEPERGDQIETEGGDVYEVQPLAGVKCWEASDRGGDTFRVHTKRIKAAE